MDQLSPSAVSVAAGDPERARASYTRFVLPFAYALTPTSQPADPTAYCPLAEADLPDAVFRHNYLTPETADVLFRRARWFRLAGAGAGGTMEVVYRDKTESSVTLLSPRLVLFEAEGVLGSREHQVTDSEMAILRTGFLLLDVCFPTAQPPTLDQMLEFNELFRYWQCPFDGHATEKRYLELLKLNAKDLPVAGRHHGPYLPRWEQLLRHQVECDGRRYQLFPDHWIASARNWTDGHRGAAGSFDAGWIVHADPRAFVWTCAIIEGGGITVRNRAGQANAAPEDLGAWVALLNVDDQAASQVSDYEREWARARTYDRWAAAGSYYGFCAHAGAVLAPPVTEPPVWRQFATMHFDQVLLLLYLRVTTFRFSQRLSEISSAAMSSQRHNDVPFRERFRRLRWAFAMFTNLYQFPLLSNQQQGVEMYEIARRNMDIDELFNEVQQEIAASEGYLDNVIQARQSDAQAVLAVVATFGLVFGLVLAWRQIFSEELRAAVSAGDALGAGRQLGVPLVILIVLFIAIIWQAPRCVSFFNKIGRRGYKK